MLSECFGESDIVAAIQSGKILEWYKDEDRCLIGGSYFVTQTTSESLHLVVDYWSESETTDWIEIVMAYIPQRPFGETPHQRGKEKEK